MFGRTYKAFTRQEWTRYKERNEAAMDRRWSAGYRAGMSLGSSNIRGIVVRTLQGTVDERIFNDLLEQIDKTMEIQELVTSKRYKDDSLRESLLYDKGSR